MLTVNNLWARARWELTAALPILLTRRARNSCCQPSLRDRTTIRRLVPVPTLTSLRPTRTLWIRTQASQEIVTTHWLVPHLRHPLRLLPWSVLARNKVESDHRCRRGTFNSKIVLETAALEDSSCPTFRFLMTTQRLQAAAAI